MAKIVRIAHLSDVHMLSTRAGGSRARHGLGHRFLSFGRRLDASRRAGRLARSLAVAKRCGADHVVLSGDLTEIGARDEFEALAEVLHDAALDADRVTLVPGNHDAYSGADAWRDAITGPLRAFASASASATADGACKVVERGDVCLVPLDVTMPQPITRSAGVMTDANADALARVTGDPAFRQRAVVVVQHHPPFSHALRAWNWVDGLQGGERQMHLLERRRNVHVLHGHLHHATDRAVGDRATRVFGAPAVVEDEDGASRVRLYELRDGQLESAGLLH